MALLITFLQVGGVLGLLYYLLTFIWKRNILINNISWLPGPPSLPIVGNITDIFFLDQAALLKKFNQLHNRFGRVYRLWIGPDPVVITMDPQIMQELSSRGRTIKKARDYEVLKSFFGESLLTTSGDEWYRRRKLINPCFHYDIVGTFLETINCHSQKFVDHLAQIAKNNEPFDFLEKAKLSTLDILTDTMMGLNVNALENKNNEYVKAISKMREIVVIRGFSPFLRFDFFYQFSSAKKEEEKAAKVLRTFIKQVIMERRRARKNISKEGNNPEKDSKKKPLLEMFLDLKDNEIQITDEDIENEINMFMFAGHDTTSVAISYAIYLMGRHPKIQERVYNELTEMFPNFPEVGLSLSDLNKLEYTDRCIKESLRMFPPIPLIGKILQKPIETERGSIPKGVNILENLMYLHNDDSIYPEPNVFNPDRFLPENAATRGLHTYIPFSSGPRICIGQKFALVEMKMLLCYLLKSYKIESLAEPEDLRPSIDVVLTPMNGIKIKISQR